MKLYIKKSSIIFVMTCLLIFRYLLETNIHLIFGYADEVIAIICFFILFYYILLKRVKIEIVCSIILLSLLLTLGFISTMLSGISKNFFANFLDAFSFSKFVLIFWAATLLCESSTSTYFNWKLLAKIVRIFIIIAFVFCIINLFRNIGMYTDYRYGLRAFHFIFSRVGGLYTACICFLTIQTIDIAYFGINSYKKVLLIITIIVMCSTLRARAFAYGAMYVIGYYFIINKKFKFKAWHIALLAGVSIIVAYPQIRFYFLDNDTQARIVLLKYGIKTAQNYFPFGAGFSSYGTYQARIFRSPLYAEYGFNRYYGLSNKYSAYLTDTYWPAVLGEFGFFGVIVMLLIIFMMIVYVYKRVKYNKIVFFAVSFQLLTIMASSVATASLINDVDGFLLIAIAASELNKTIESKYKIMGTKTYYNHGRKQMLCHIQ